MGIIVEWWNDSTEYIDGIDPDNLEGLQQVNMITTRDWWHHQERWVEYNVGCHINWNGQGANGGHIVVLTYNEANNPGLQGEDIIWGINRIYISQEQDLGFCGWAGEGEERVWPRSWKKKELYETRNHRRSTQQIRDEKFRPQIIALDGMCVISHETTKAALDAAHIIRAADEGNEIPENGIALRADIHRLYDRGMFNIHPETGQTAHIAYDELSEDYIDLLEDSVLPDATLQRVSTALQEVWPGG